jgi:hypothetical protein
VNLNFDAGVTEFRAEVAAWLAEHVPAALTDQGSPTCG